jgi:hypothetical protein
MVQIIESVPLTLIALELPGCGAVEALPEAIFRLSALQTLNLKGCAQLQVPTLTNVCRQLAAGNAFLGVYICDRCSVGHFITLGTSYQSGHELLSWA